MNFDNDYYSDYELLLIVMECHNQFELIESSLIIGSLIGEGCKINDTAFKKYSKKRLTQLNANSSRNKR